MRKYSFTLFPCFCFQSSFVAIWFVLLDSVSVLRFNFVFFVCVFPVGDGYFRFGIRVSVFWWCFSVLGFRLCLMCFCFVCFSGLFSAIFVVVVVLCFFVSISHPIYLISESSAFKSNHWRTLQNSVENFFTEIKSFR